MGEPTRVPTVGSVIGLTTALDAKQDTVSVLGLVLRQVTDSQRTAKTWAVNDIVWTTDTHLWYRGDGIAAGANAVPLPFTYAELVTLGVIQNRARRISQLIEYVRSTADATNIPASLTLGNSIMYGGSASTFAARMANVYAARMASIVGVGSTAQWTPTQLAVPSSLTEQVMINLADSADTTSCYPVRGGWFAKTVPGWAFLLTERNEYLTTLNDFTLKLRLSLLECQRHNLDAVVMLDPPEINPTTGAIVDAGTPWYEQRQAQLTQAAICGASVIDVWTYMATLLSMGFDLRQYFYTDGIHPVDLGNADEGNLMVMFVTGTPSPAAFTWNHIKQPAQRYKLICRNYSGGSTVDWNNGTSLPITLNQGTTARAYQLGETTPQVRVLSSGDVSIIPVPAPCSGFIVDWYQNQNNGGTASISLNHTYPIVTISGLTDHINSAPRSKAKLYKLDMYSAPINMWGNYANAPPHIRISASGGQVSFTSVTFVCPFISETHVTYPNATVTGTWASQALVDSPSAFNDTGIGSSNVGDTLVLKWWGTAFHCHTVCGAYGKFSYSTDGGSSATMDCYWGTGPRVAGVTLAKDLTLGWHTTTITVAAKNASSASNQIGLSKFQTVVDVPDPKVAYVSIGSGETLQLPEVWGDAYIVQTISGSPVLSFVPGAATMSCSGGAAVVRLER